MSRTFPKEGVKKLKEAIRQMKGELRQKEKEVAFLQRELENVQKPQRVRKDKPSEAQSDEVRLEEWKRDFVKRFRKETQ